MKQLTCFSFRITTCNTRLLISTRVPLFWVVAFFLFSFNPVAQSQDIRPTCGFDHAHQEAMTLDPDFAARVAAYDQAWVEKAAHSPNQRSMTNTVYTIPVVFHIMNVGEPIGTGSNLSAARINATMDYLNAVFSKSVSLSPARGGADIEIQFALATHAPDCSVTTGITRHDFSGNATYVTYGVERQTTDGIPDTDVRSAIQWDPSAYMNVWVVNKVDGWNGLVAGSGVVGWATFPGGAAANDGIIMMAAFTNTNQATLSHEVGHYLNLYHTFQAPAPSGSCPTAANDDKISDTEAHALRGDFACGPSLTNSCNGNLPYSVVETVAGTPLTVLNNYMNYASQSCTVMFSPGQKTRMRDALETLRPGLLSSSAFMPGGSAPVAACAVSAPAGIGTGGYFGIARTVLNTLNVASSSSYADGKNYTDYTCTQATTMTVGTAYTASVTPFHTNWQFIKIWIDYNNDGDFLDAGETVLSGATTGGTVISGSITPPATAVVNTPLRMRVKAEYGGFETSLAAMSSCSFIGANATYGNGQVEDYTVTLLSPYISTTYADITTCPRVVLLGETTAGKGNDVTTWSCGTKNGNDIAYRITLPAGATKLFVNIENVSAPIDAVWLNTSNLPAGCVSATALTTGTPCQLEYTVAGAGTYYLVIDHNNGSDVTYDIRFGAVTGSMAVPAVSDTRGTFALEPSVCEATMFKKATKVLFNSVAQNFPLTLSPLNIPGVLCTKVFLQNTTGQEGVKTASFNYGPDITLVSPTSPTMTGFYNTGTWTATQSGQTVTWEFADAAATGRGDWTGSPATCLGYSFCVNITPVSNDPVRTLVVGTFTGDGEGSPTPAGTVSTGCCASTNTPVCCPMFGGAAARTPSVLSIDYNDPAPLPIKLLVFEGRLTAKKTVELTWQTTSEQNSSHFEIMRSADNLIFETIGSVNAAGNSNSTLDYTFEDLHAQTNLRFYRLKMIDNDGTYEYSHIISVQSAREDTKWSVYPNPASSAISLESNEATTAKLYTIQGQVIAIISINKGINTIPIAHLARGVYYIKEVTGGQFVKIIKE